MVVVWTTCLVRTDHGLGLWKAIRKWGHLVTYKISFEVGNGQRVKF